MSLNWEKHNTRKPDKAFNTAKVIANSNNRMTTEKQKNFIKTLSAELGISAYIPEIKEDAMEHIDRLLKRKKKG